MPKYENALIYKLIHKDDYENANIYIGSTTNFKMRKYKHKSDCNNQKGEKYNQSNYQFIRKNGGWAEWDMIQLEAFPCNNEQELKCRERYYIELMKSNLNMTIPTRTAKEYRENNRDIIIEKSRQKWVENRAEILEKRTNNIAMCEYCSCFCRKANLKKHQGRIKCLKAQAKIII